MDDQAEYNKVPGWRSTQLKNINKYGLFDTLHPEGLKQPENAFKFGNLFHTLVLENHLFYKRYATAPKFDLRTKEGKAEMEQWGRENATKTIITSDEYDMAKGMADVVMMRYGSFIEKAKREVIYYTEMDGVKCKVMVDIVNEEQGIFADLKSTAELLVNHKMRYVMADYDYDLSYAYYHDVMELCGVPTQHFGLLFSSKKDYRALFFRPTQNVLEVGRAKYQAAINKVIAYEQRGEVADVSVGIDLPEWAKQG